MESVEQLVHRVGLPVVCAAGGAASAYFLEKGLQEAIASRPWVLPLLGGLAGAGAGYLLSRTL